tara:strand:- start:499 stop:852 length:354 start_codon:yes stop_codon:yes gene_type:complete
MNLEERIEQLEKQKEILQTSIRNFQVENRQMKDKVRAAEGETSIVKGIGINSPEMRALQTKVKDLENSLAIALEVNESHQRYNGKLQTRLTEVEEDNKKLATQVEDQLDRFRKSGGM